MPSDLYCDRSGVGAEFARNRGYRCATRTSTPGYLLAALRAASRVLGCYERIRIRPLRWAHPHTVMPDRGRSASAAVTRASVL